MAWTAQEQRWNYRDRRSVIKESDRCKYLVNDCIDTCSRMSDRVMGDAARGISEHLEEILLEASDKEIDDVVTASLVVVGAIMKPITETMLAATNDRHSRARSKTESVTT